MFFAALLNSLRFVRVLLLTFCSKCVLFIAKTRILFRTVNGQVLFSIYSRVLDLVYNIFLWSSKTWYTILFCFRQTFSLLCILLQGLIF